MATPVWLSIPFAGLLLCIALFPIMKADWWEEHKALVVAFWSVLTLILFTMVFGPAASLETAVDCLFNDYVTFIVLLFGLYCVSGNITFTGDLAGSPAVNVGLLAIGTFLSSCIGTTGSSMLMIRPVIRMNSWRRRRAHIMVFFIFLISNIGGCLTPVGDPPLLMGFMHGVSFFWSLHLFPVMLLNMAVLLFIFYHIDMKEYRADVADGRKPDISKPGTELKIGGGHNIIFLIAIVAAVVLSGTLSNYPMFQNADGSAAGVPLPGGKVFPWASVIEIVIILISALLSFVTTNREVRRKNHFTWGAIEEVATLFIGIFITMQPALILLKEVGPQLGLNHPAQMFWATGILSSFLDNTPTYLVFLTTAGTLDFTQGMMTTLGIVPANMLMAISCGAVFMGAITYIGNAPNFMVKSMSDENGIAMPSFFGYLKWSVKYLVPVFLLDTVIFFL
ncbi:MAG: sodium:proton antiporter [Bacillota bacterium]|nr:sodium:proton antiporter [Bacillota bacterium]